MVIKKHIRKSREDQREENNLPKMHEDQGQGRMLVIDEAKAAHFIARELVEVAKLLAFGNETYTHDMSVKKHHKDCQCARCKPLERPCDCQHCRGYRKEKSKKT